MGRNDLQKLLERKKKIKEHFFAQCWPNLNKTTPLLIVFAPNDNLHRELLYKLLEGFLALNVVAIVVSENDMPDHLRHPQGKISWIAVENGRNMPKIAEWLKAADMALVFDEKRATIQMLLENGVIPVGLEKSPFLANYEPHEETGNSFTFKAINCWDIFAAVVRALETYHFPYDWEHILRGVLKVR